jgi:hypothetical protein
MEIMQSRIQVLHTIDRMGSAYGLRKPHFGVVIGRLKSAVRTLKGGQQLLSDFAFSRIQIPHSTSRRRQ